MSAAKMGPPIWRRFLQPRHDCGKTGEVKEDLARRFLEGKGLRHVAQNVGFRHGEIDLIMLDSQTLVFVEVRYRHSEHFGGAAASVDRRKQARLIAAAGLYLQRHPTVLACRFDVVAIGAGDRTQWIQGAFDGDTR